MKQPFDWLLARWYRYAAAAALLLWALFQVVDSTIEDKRECNRRCAPYKAEGRGEACWCDTSRVAPAALRKEDEHGTAEEGAPRAR